MYTTASKKEIALAETNLLDTIRRSAVCKDFCQIAVINAIHTPLQILPTDFNILHQLIVLFFLQYLIKTILQQKEEVYTQHNIINPITAAHYTILTL